MHAFSESSKYGNSSDRHDKSRFVKNFRFSTLIFQNYPGTTRTTEIVTILYVEQVCCDKISSIAVKSYKY